MTCIYCLRPSIGPYQKAHIFPESIFGDHRDLVLRNGEVCGKCNNRLARLEAAFKDRLGIIPLLVGPGRNKAGIPTTVNVPGIWASRDPRDPRIRVNASRRPATFGGGQRVMPALHPDERIEFVPLEQGPEGHLFRIGHGMRLDDVFIRMLTKIGFETICFHRGAEYCADLRWHRVRAFFLRSEGERTYAMPKSLEFKPGPGGTIYVSVGIRLEPVYTDYGEEWLAAIRVGPSFAVDLSANNVLIGGILSIMPADVRENFELKTCVGRATKDARGT
jgi:hypothetical protein